MLGDKSPTYLGGSVIYHIYLVGGFKHFLFSIIYGIILPIDFHIFQDGYCTTNQVFHGTIVGLFDGLYEWYHQIGYLWRSINT